MLRLKKTTWDEHRLQVDDILRNGMVVDGLSNKDSTCFFGFMESK